MSKMKKLFSIVLSLILLGSIQVMASAMESKYEKRDNSVEAKSSQSVVQDFGYSDERSNVLFPEGIPSELTSEQIQAILCGEGVKTEIEGAVTVYNPEKWYAYRQGNSFISNTDADQKSETWLEPLDIDWTWWPEYGKLEFKPSSYSWQPKHVYTTFFLGNQDQTDGNQTGQAWCLIKMAKNGSVPVQAVSNVVRTQFLNGLKYVAADCSSKEGSVAEYVQYAYRNTRTDWKRSFTVNNSQYKS